MRPRGDRAAAAVALAAGALLAAGCAGWTTDPALTLHVDSRIDRPLLVYVNGDWVGTIPAGATDATVPAAGHGGPPWTVEGRVASGAVLVTLAVPAVPAPGETVAASVAAACGTLTVTAGAPVPGRSAAQPAPAASLAPCE